MFAPSLLADNGVRHNGTCERVGHHSFKGSVTVNKPPHSIYPKNGERADCGGTRTFSGQFARKSQKNVWRSPVALASALGAVATCSSLKRSDSSFVQVGEDRSHFESLSCGGERRGKNCRKRMDFSPNSPNESFRFHLLTTQPPPSRTALPSLHRTHFHSLTTRTRLSPPKPISPCRPTSILRQLQLPCSIKPPMRRPISSRTTSRRPRRKYRVTKAARSSRPTTA